MKHLAHPRRILDLLEKEKANTGSLQSDLTKLKAQFDRERQKEGKLLDLFTDDKLNKTALKIKLEEVALRVAKLEGRVNEAQVRLAMIEGKTKEAQTLQRDIKALSAEGVRRVFRVLDKLDNKELKTFLRMVIDGRLKLDSQGKPHGDMNLSAGYEYLARFVTSSA
jgi:hypothetical protein